MNSKVQKITLIVLSLVILFLVAVVVFQHTAHKAEQQNDTIDPSTLSENLEAQLISGNLSNRDAEKLLRQLISLLFIRIRSLEEQSDVLSNDADASDADQNQSVDGGDSIVVPDSDTTPSGDSSSDNDDSSDNTEVLEDTADDSNDSGQTSQIDTRFSDDFELAFNFDALTAWSSKQLVNGTVERITDPTNTRNIVARAVAGAQRGGTVGKADLIKKYVPIQVGSEIVVEADFYFPSGSAMDKVHIMDVECDNCGVPNTPGIRLYVRDGVLEVDRGKIGYNDDFVANSSSVLQAGRWYRISLRLAVGEGNQGSTLVVVDGSPVINERGTNIISQSVINQYELTLESQHIDSIQVGLTANSNSTDQSVLIDNVNIAVD